MSVKKQSGKLVILSLISFVFFLSSCNSSGNNKEGKDTGGDSSSVKKDSAEVKKNNTKSGWEIKTNPDRKYNDVARLIAGMPQLDGGLKDSLETNPAWKKYSTSADSAWKTLDRTRLSVMRKWRDEELTPANNTTLDVFYPFSGPDFLNVYTLFPNAKSYTFLALEPAGDLPKATKLKGKGMEAYLNSVSKAINDIFQRSYFITSRMANDLGKNSVNGALPVISLFMQRTGNTIVNVERVWINKEGKVVSTADSSKRKLNRGVRVYFKTKDSEELRMVQYFSADISDEALQTNLGMVKFLESLPDVNCYVKSASYLMHYKTFNIIRNACLNHAKHLMQDDSGIAFRFFEKGKWNIRLYGKYYKPIKDFSGVDQPDLKEAYKKDSANVKAVPFILGYHWRSHEAPNLMIADRK